MKLPKGVPTPDEEALQEPTIDPIFMLASGLTGGLANAAPSYNMSGLRELLEGGNPKQLMEKTPALINAAKGVGGNIESYLANLLVNKAVAPNLSNETQNAASIPTPRSIGTLPRYAAITQEEAAANIPDWVRALGMLGVLGADLYNSPKKQK